MGDVDYSGHTRVIRIGMKRPGFRNYLDYFRYLVFTFRKSVRSRYDLIIGYDLFGFVAAFLMAMTRKNTITRTSKNSRVVLGNKRPIRNCCVIPTSE